jgi:hypothetical protein
MYAIGLTDERKSTKCWWKGLDGDKHERSIVSKSWLRKISEPDKFIIDRARLRQTQFFVHGYTHLPVRFLG